ncbi:GTPase Era, mitochondrial isoform X1 [Protopterus annectens]|uniref:GTPase Era, mitochondrial isoform X1 n=2 Tax=Protopterus annectens TaxID=7888 RepID=UPI001CF9C5F8|nr:GTPase Era, mitochondrial isoform X1 [Protopterus annectens]
MGLMFCGRLLGCSLRITTTFYKPVSSLSLPKISASRGHSFVPVSFYNHDSALDYMFGAVEKPKEDKAGHHAAIPPHRVDQEILLTTQPAQPENARILKVAIIGAPNSGKSTLSNQLLGRKIFPVSKKVHTTRCLAQGVISEDETQIILLDTPGLTSPSKGKRHHLERSLINDPLTSMQRADFVLVMVDVSDHWTRSHLSYDVLKCLAQNIHLPAALILNKVDLLKNKGLLLALTVELTEGFVNGKKLKVKSRLKKPENSADCPKKILKVPAANAAERFAHEGKLVVDSESSSFKLNSDTDEELRNVLPTSGSAEYDSKLNTASQDLALSKRLKSMKGWPYFREVFMLSAINGDEVETLKRFLAKQAKPGPWVFHSEVVTDQLPQEICENIIREKLLEYLPQEVPYSVTQSTEQWEEGKSGELLIVQKLLVVKENHAKMLIGPGGHLIKRIAQEAGIDLMNAFMRDVKLNLSVNVKKCAH